MHPLRRVELRELHGERGEGEGLFVIEIDEDEDTTIGIEHEGFYINLVRLHRIGDGDGPDDWKIDQTAGLSIPISLIPKLIEALQSQLA
jgi:hypothetical protein